MSPTAQHPKTHLLQSIDFFTTPRFLSKKLSFSSQSISFSYKINYLNVRGVKQGFVPKLDDDPPVSLELQQINSETQFDQVLAEAQQLQEPLIIVWYVLMNQLY